MGTNLLNPFEIFAIGGAQRSADFDGTNYGFDSYRSEYELQNFEYEWQGIWQTGSSRIYGINQSNVNGRRSGHILIASSGGGIQFQYTTGASNSVNKAHTEFTFADLLGTTVKINFKAFGTSYEFTVNGTLESGTISTTFIYNTGDGTACYVGRRSTSSSALPFIGTMDYCRYFELNGSGVRINDFIDYNFNNGDADTVPNTAADAPASSDLTWTPAGSGVYV